MSYFILGFFLILLFFVFIYDYCKKRKKLSKDGKIVNKTFFGILSFLLGLIYSLFLRFLTSLGILFFFLLLFNEIIPFKTKLTEIRTESGKTILFQGMTHLGTQEFYDKVKENIEKYTEEGYVVFFEGIHGGNEEEINKLNDSLSIEISSDLYEKVAGSFDRIVQQDYEYLFSKNGNDSENVKNVDMNISDLVKNVSNKKINEKNKSSNIMKEIGEEGVNLLGEYKKNYLVQYSLQGSLNMISSLPLFLRTQLLKINGANSDFFEGTIINERNRHLAKEVNNSKDQKILIIYGQEHLEGFKEELNKLDKIKSDLILDQVTPFQ